jgi:hypothetical protein
MDIPWESHFRQICEAVEDRRNGHIELPWDDLLSVTAHVGRRIRQAAR